MTNPILRLNNLSYICMGLVLVWTTGLSGRISLPEYGEMCSAMKFVAKKGSIYRPVRT